MLDRPRRQSLPLVHRPPVDRQPVLGVLIFTLHQIVHHFLHNRVPSLLYVTSANSSDDNAEGAPRLLLEVGSGDIDENRGKPEIQRVKSRGEGRVGECPNKFFGWRTQTWAMRLRLKKHLKFRAFMYLQPPNYGTRNSSADEIANANFLRRHRTRTTK